MIFSYLLVYYNHTGNNNVPMGTLQNLHFSHIHKIPLSFQLSRDIPSLVFIRPGGPGGQKAALSVSLDVVFSEAGKL